MLKITVYYLDNFTPSYNMRIEREKRRGKSKESSLCSYVKQNDKRGTIYRPLLESGIQLPKNQQ